jgi:hypothetical protein
MGAVDVDLTGQVLSVNYTDSATDSLNLAINTTGYDASGANVTNGTGTITELNVTFANTSNTSNFTLTDASQNLTGGLTISSQLNDVTISSDVTAGNISIQAEDVGLDGSFTATGNVTAATPTAGNIELLGAGTTGVSLGLNGDTTIDAGTGVFAVQKGSSSTHPGGNIVSQGESYDLTITAGNIIVPGGIGVAPAGSGLSSPELTFYN